MILASRSTLDDLHAALGTNRQKTTKVGRGPGTTFKIRGTVLIHVDCVGLRERECVLNSLTRGYAFPPLAWVTLRPICDAFSSTKAH